MRHRAIELFHKRIDYIMRYGHKKTVANRCCGMCKYCGDVLSLYLDIDNIYCTRNEKALKVTDYRTCYTRGKSNIKIISTYIKTRL